MTRFRLLPALALGALVVAISGCGGDNALSLVSGGWPGVCGLIHVVFVVLAFVKLANSSADTGSKILWGAVIFFFPVIGLIAWWLWGPKS
ncbi:PLD nuclease N-terminal domain-containing protein [Rubrivirga sp. IMCC43871]|uniref:PLD nuclease N-terminal domain-containing protein n=1 Tax=Rubrivirga sp. IMCC43871 TaxID=3391575 RepID=UPI00398FFA9C